MLANWLELLYQQELIDALDQGDSARCLDDGDIFGLCYDCG